jgi:tRNA threonylcarbamoyl adenosine modification protein YeaZ
MLVLGIDTSSAVVAAALADDAGVVAAGSRQGAQAHGELLAPVVDEVLREAGRTPDELTHVVVGVGPGPFTGLRVGVVTGLVLGEALGIPVLGVCSLDVVAAAYDLGTPFAVVADARRKEVHVARYDADGHRVSEPVVVRPADLDPDVRRGPVVGPGAALYAGLFADVRSDEPLSARALGAVAAAVAGGSSAYAVLDPEPLYLRRPDAVENATRKRVTQP